MTRGDDPAPARRRAPRRMAPTRPKLDARLAYLLGLADRELDALKAS